jgi:small subunit ribosomal protein S21|tara:strand:+ start:288 stop:500 length:213 start_codon:yes stop_codon:yes gene_type:complete
MDVKKKHKGESFDSLFRRFKKGVEKKDIINEVKSREYYVKPSIKRKLAKEFAQKNESKRQEEQDVKRIPV